MSFTFNSMEECDALCTRLAIMVNGTFTCLGSSQHLKSKFGTGYALICRVAMPQEGGHSKVGPLKSFIQSKFPENLLMGTDGQGYVSYQLTSNRLSLAHIFGTMEKAKGQFNIEDYSVAQTTLEQVFLNFAKHQKQSPQSQGGICSCLCCCS